jgi:hypothetical protein
MRLQQRPLAQVKVANTAASRQGLKPLPWSRQLLLQPTLPPWTASTESCRLALHSDEVCPLLFAVFLQPVGIGEADNVVCGLVEGGTQQSVALR